MNDIRKGIAELILDWTNCVKEDATDNYGLATKIITYLKSKGMVRKVDRELPDTDPCIGCELDDGTEHSCQGHCLEKTEYKARIGAVAVEDLI